MSSRRRWASTKREFASHEHRVNQARKRSTLWFNSFIPAAVGDGPRLSDWGKDEESSRGHYQRSRHPRNPLA
jgi:hypothetical protein